MNRKKRNFLKMAKKNGGCWYCKFPGDGCNIFPYYGLAPHTSFHILNDKLVIGTRYTGKCGKNFSPDPEDPDFGVYTHCPVCGQFEGER